MSRAALLTGRYAVRTGATQGAGITLWEVTIAEALKSVGYATGALRQVASRRRSPEGKREPTHQGFDEYYGIPRTSNEAQTTIAQGQTAPGTSFIWEGKAGEPSRNVKPFDMDTRRTVDRESAERGIAFMERSVREQQAVLPLLPDHADPLSDARRIPTSPARPAPATSRDAMAEVDYNVGLVLDAIDRLGIARNTIVLWCTDNGAEQRRPWRGSSGPWRGFYNTRDGRRHPHAVHHPLAGPDSRRTGLERDRARDRHLSHPRGRGRRRHRAEGSRDRRRQPAAVPRRQAGEVEPRQRAASTPTRSCAP